jgi:hypothetical protein
MDLKTLRKFTQAHVSLYFFFLLLLCAATSLVANETILQWVVPKSEISVGININVGDFIVTRSTLGNNFFEIYESEAISLIDVTMLECGGFGIYLFGGTGGHLLERFKMTYAPPPFVGAEAPLCTCSADAIHVTANTIGPTVINSLIEGNQVPDSNSNLSFFFFLFFLW